MRFEKLHRPCFLLMVLLFCAGLLVAVGTDADAAGGISGRVMRDGTADPIAGLNIYALDPNNTADWAGSAQTQADGTYAISGLAPGEYKVYAYASGTYYLSEWYNDTYDYGSAATVTVHNGSPTQNIDFSMTLGGLIYGRVIPYPIDNLLDSLRVYAYNVSTDKWVGSAAPVGGGIYVLALLPGQYKVFAEAPGTAYASEWYFNAHYGSAATVNVAAGVTTIGVNFSLARGGSVSGSVTGAGIAGPVAGLKIFAYEFSSDAYAGEAQTRADGTYAISGLTPGQYRIYADTEGTNYASQWYNHILYDLAVPVNVAADQTIQGIDFSLGQGGRISGKVTGAGTADPIADIQILAVELSSGYWAGSAQTQADGTYAISGLSTGQYRVFADASGTNYVSGYYDNTLVYDSAKTVNVASGQTAQNIDFGLAPGDSISGAVMKEGTPNPIAGIPVYAYDFSTDEWAGSAQSQADGAYTISGLAPGQYRVYAFASDWNYASEWYNNAVDYDSAIPVVVAIGQPALNVDFSLATGGSIFGTIFLDGAGGLVPPDLEVTAFDAVTGEWAGSARTQSDGTYIIAGLAPGQYRVQITSSGTYYVSEWYDNAAQRDSATLVNVASGQTTAGINFTISIYPLTTVTTSPAELQVVVDGKTYTSPAVFGWSPGTAHTISVPSPQTKSGGAGIQYEYRSWSDGKAQTHIVTAPDAAFIYMAAFERLVGDVDGSHTVDIRDAVLALQVVAGMEPANISKAASLVYGDKIGIREALYILQKAAGLR